MNNFLKNSFLTESENFNINNIVFCAVESLYSYIMLVTWRSSLKLNVKELNCVKNKGIGCFIHVVLAVPPRARGQLLAVSFGKFHSHNIGFPSAKDFLGASAKQLRFVTAL